jgi:lysophospholipase L1-like esterase
MRIILLGDSITQGLGSKSVNFVEELKKRLNTDDTILNWALTGTTIDYIETIMGEIEVEKPDCVVLIYGNVDAQIKPSRTGKVFKRLPKRFRGPNGAMIMPRPFYSHALYKRILQLFENMLRTFFRKLVYAIDGTEQWMPFESYKHKLQDVYTQINDLGVRIILCSTVYIDDKLFPGSDGEYRKYNEYMRRFAADNAITYVDLYASLKNAVDNGSWKEYYNYDHFHPNGNGYLVMAEMLAEALRN